MVLYVLVFSQPGGWEIVEKFREMGNTDVVYKAFVLPFSRKANRVYRVYADNSCDILKGNG